jgi:hypothetical protein
VCTGYYFPGVVWERPAVIPLFPLYTFMAFTEIESHPKWNHLLRCGMVNYTQRLNELQVACNSVVVFHMAHTVM